MDKLLAVCLGFVLGGFFCGGLRWTLVRALRSPRPSLWLTASWWLRLSVVAGALAAQGDPGRIAACLGGFLLARRRMIHAT